MIPHRPIVSVPQFRSENYLTFGADLCYTGAGAIVVSAPILCAESQIISKSNPDGICDGEWEFDFFYSWQYQ